MKDPLVLMHGFTGSSASWEPVLEGLRAAGRAPRLMDLPGHGTRAGESDPELFTLDATLAGIADAEEWPADLIGYSMGGRIALHFAFAFPERVRRLVLESASPGLPSAAARAERREADERLARRVVEMGVEAFVDEWEVNPLFASQARLDPALRRRQRRLRASNAAESLAAALRGLGTGTLPSLWDRLSDLPVPTLLLVGAHDEKFVDIAHRCAERLPDARVCVVPDCGHTVHLERPAEWVREVLSFLR